MKKTIKKRKVKKRAILLFLSILLLIFFIVFYVLNFHITNIYVSGNTVYTDQQIIDMAELSDYPRTLNHNELIIKNILEKDIYIKKVNVKKRNFFREIYIDITENRPLIIYNNQTILQDGTEIDEDFNLPSLINNVENAEVYKRLLNKLNDILPDIYPRISDIKYEPNNADKERFLFTMSDGNCVYITLRKIDRINNYIDIISAFDGKKGTLYLDSGEYFEVYGGE